MIRLRSKLGRFTISIIAPLLSLSGIIVFLSVPVAAQSRVVEEDPVEPLQGRPNLRMLARPAGAMQRDAVDEKSMRELIGRLVACGTRNSLSSWDDPKRGAGCGRDQIVARINEIANASGGKLQGVVDKFEATGPRTSNKPAHMENVYGILPGADPAMSKTVFIISGHFDSRASDVMDPSLDAPGADDDASGVAVSMECARLLSKTSGDAGEPFRATLLFAAISGEEQGLLGSERMLEWVKEQGYTVGGMLDNDIVGSDAATSAPHRARLFSPDFQYRPSRPRWRSLRILQSRPARCSLHGTARGLSPSASDAAHGERNRIWRSDEILEFQIHGQCSSEQCGSAAAVGARTCSADGSETFGWSFA
jgi:hypothetical protein